jgi:diamine N-acetyltransferase
MERHEADVVVVGQKVALGPLQRGLAPSHARWMNQLEVRRGLNFMGVATPETQEKRVEETTERSAKSEPSTVELTIYDRSDSTAVGTVGLLRINHAHGTAELGIAIGERRGQGLGTEATRPSARLRLLRAASAQCAPRDAGLERRGLNAYERAGFRRVGVRRGAVMSRGRRTDVVLMDAVPEDLSASVLR